MLELLLGRAGSGKTTEIYRRLEAAVRQGGRAILLVPEQFSFESEKELYRRLGPRLGAGAEVLSFTRLCDNIFRRYGGLAQPPLTDTARPILMSIAVGELADTLTLYRGQLGNTAFAQSLVEAVGEFKNAGVTPDDLRRFSDEQEKGLLRDKTAELANIYHVYQTLVEAGYSDPEDDLTRALALLENDFFADCPVFIDAFLSFTASEYRMLGRIIGAAPKVTAAFCCDSLHDDEGGLGVFSPAKAAASRLVRLAREQGTQVAAPHRLTGSHRFATPALELLESQFLQPKMGEEPEGEGVTLVAARDVYDELEFVAADICRLVREEGWRYRDIAIICRSLEGYAIPAQRMLERYGVPVFLDLRRSVENTPVVSLILAALETVRTGFEAEQVLRFAKCLALGLPLEEVAALENHCYIWGISGRALLEPFTGHPRGLAEGFTQGDEEALRSINATREAVAAPLAALAEGLKNPDGFTFATAIYQLLTQVDAASHLGTAAAAMGEEEGRLFLEEQGAVWDGVMEILSVFGQAIGHRGFPLGRLIELLRIGLATLDIGRIPQTLDQVILGVADRIRPGSPKATYVIGAVEGEFPATFSGGGVFTEPERQKLLAGGIELAEGAQGQAVREKFFAYFALTSPSHRLTISYPRATLTGEGKTPSVLLREAGEILGLPLNEASTLREQAGPVGAATALDVFADQCQGDTPRRAALRQFLEEAGAAPTLRRIEEQTPVQSYRITRRRVAQGLFGGEMRLSPSRVEHYYNCPFAYFCASGLRLGRRRRVEFSPLESGTVIHTVLQVMVERHGGKGLGALTDEALRVEISEVIDTYLADKLQHTAELPARFRYLYTRLVGLLLKLLRQLALEFSQCDFEPVAFELEIAKGGKVEPVELMTPTGERIWVEGKVDRVDLLEQGGRRYVRVIDYKSGSKTFTLSDVYYGLNMQMLIYLFSIWQNGREEMEGVLPAGVLYMPAKGGFLSTDRGIPPEELQKEQAKTYRMSGLLLEEPQVLSGMEREVAGVFIPAKRKASGDLDATSSVANLARMGKLRGLIERNITQMASSLLEGQVGAVPAMGGGYQPCSYCDFAAVCGYEEGGPARAIDKLRPDDLFTLLDEILEDETAPPEELQTYNIQEGEED